MDQHLKASRRNAIGRGMSRPMAAPQSPQPMMQPSQAPPSHRNPRVRMPEPTAAPSSAAPTSHNTTMDDYDYLHDLLLTEKNLGHGYTLASMEASNMELARMATQMFHDVQRAQQHLFQCLHNHGKYPVEGALAAQIRQKNQRLSKIQQELPYPR